MIEIRASMSIAIAVGLATSSAVAQTAAAPTDQEPPGLEEIVVTATKRPENLQRAPAAITSVSGNDLQVRDIEDIRAASELFPSVRFSEVADTTHLYIRGIGAEQDRASISQLTTMTLNGVIVPHDIASLNLYDIASVQVLPGPQSTLYGNGAAGGAVVVTTRAATQEREATTSVETGNFGQVRFSTSVNTPLTDSLAVRYTGDYSTINGYESSGSGALRHFTGRVSALWTPTDDFTATPWIDFFKVDGSPPNAVGTTGNGTYANPHNPWDDSTCAPSPIGVPYGASCSTNPFNVGASRQDLKAVLTGADFVWHLPAITATFTPGFVYHDQDRLQYFSPFPNAQQLSNHQFSGELRVANSSPDRLHWVAGLFAYKNAQYQFYSLNGSLGNPEIHDTDTTYALYGDATFSVSHDFRLTAGVRASSNKKEGYGCNCTAGDNVGIYFNADHTWDRGDWKVGAEYDVTPTSFAYATAQTGFTDGAYQYFNRSGLLGPQNEGPAPIVDPSTLLSYTVGLKNRFLNETLQINDEVFYYDYKDLLIAAVNLDPAAFGNTFYSAKTVHIHGDQLDVLWAITSADRFNLNVGYLHARAVDFIVGNPAVNYDGSQLLASPDWTINLGYRHTWTLASNAVDFQANTHYESQWFATFDQAPPTRQAAHTKSDSELTWHSQTDKWSVTLFGKNLENAAVKSVCATVSSDFAVCSLEPPRMFGVRLTSSFD